MGRFISLSLLVACLCILPAFAATALLSTSFKNGPGSWAVMGGTGSLRVSRDAPDLRDNEPALAFDSESSEPPSFQRIQAHSLRWTDSTFG